MNSCGRCGHSKSEHTIAVGPNSIGQHFYPQLCGHDALHYGYEVLTNCKCPGYKWFTVSRLLRRKEK